MVDEIFALDSHLIPIDKDRVLHALGYPTAEAASDVVLGELPGWIDQTLQKANPHALFRIVDIYAEGGLVNVEGGLTFHSRLLSVTMSEISEAMMLVVTLGDEISNLIRELNQDRPLEALGVDAAASELVEASADQLEVMAAEALRPGLPNRSLRFSPGYCDWEINELPQLLGSLDPSRIGVSQTSGGMMTPPKTIAGLTGLSASPDAAARNPCRHCGKKNCDHRR